MSQILYANSPFAQFVDQVAPDLTNDLNDSIVDDCLFDSVVDNQQHADISNNIKRNSIAMIFRHIFFGSIYYFTKDLWLSVRQACWSDCEADMSILFANLQLLDDSMASRLFQLIDNTINIDYNDKNNIDNDDDDDDEKQKHFLFIKTIFVCLFIITQLLSFYILFGLDLAFQWKISILFILILIIISCCIMIGQCWRISKQIETISIAKQQINSLSTNAKQFERQIFKSIRTIQESELLSRGFRMYVDFFFFFFLFWLRLRYD
jgi:hypothetical protein